MNGPDNRTLLFGDFSLTLMPLRLCRDGATVRLRTQALRLLVRLAERPGELLTHRQIQDALWNGRVVDFSGGTHVCVRQLRAALGDQAGHPRYIETVPRRGYRFIAPVTEVAAMKPAVAAPTAHRRLSRRMAATVVALAGVVALALFVAVRDDVRESPGQRTARDAYLRGKFLLDDQTPDNLARSVTYFQSALAADSEYAEAHAALADAYRRLGNQDLGKRHAKRAVLLDPGSADARVQLAIALMQHDWDWAAAGRQLERALELDPRSAKAHHVSASRSAIVGDLQAALDHMDSALRLDPVSTLLRADYGWFLYFAGHHDEAIAHCRAALDLDPKHIASHLCIARAAETSSDFPAAAESMLRIMALWNAQDTDRDAVARLPANSTPRAFHEWRLRFFEAYPDRSAITPEDMADVNAALGNFDVAIDDLERAADLRSPLLPILLADPLLAPIRGDRRYRSLRTRLNLG